MFEGLANRARREADQQIAMAWHVVAFDRQKRLKPLGDYLAKRGREKREPQSLEQMQLIAQMFAAAGLGTYECPQ